MEKTDFNHIIFNLSELIQPANDLDQLQTAFQREEIDDIIFNLPNNKSPGPDGFTNQFIRGCWPLVADDFYKLCDKFFNREVCLRSINNSYIVSIPKKDGPQGVSDYRPISLLNTSIKLLTKLLANRLQKKIRGLIHKN